MPARQPVLTLKRIAIACVLSLLFFAPLLLVLIPLGFWVWHRDRHAPAAGSSGPRPTGPRPQTDVHRAPFPGLGRSFKFQVPRANEFIHSVLGLPEESVDEDFIASHGDNAGYVVTFAQKTTARDGIIQLMVLPFGVQAIELDKDGLRPGLLPEVDRLIEKELDSSATGSDIDMPENLGLKNGSGFEIESIESGASADKNGVRIYFRTKGSGNVGNPQRREDVPFLYVVFMIGEREDVFLAPCAEGAPDWSFDEVFFNDTGIVDIAGDIAFAAQIVNHHGKDLSPESIVPRSPVVTGVVRARSKKMPL